MTLKGLKVTHLEISQYLSKMHLNTNYEDCSSNSSKDIANQMNLTVICYDSVIWCDSVMRCVYTASWS